MKTITVGANTYTLVTMPATPAPASIEMGMNDSVATVESPYTKQLQTQIWPGADWWDGTMTMPPMKPTQAAPWEAFLAALQGQLNVFQAPDWRRVKPMGNVLGSAPTCAAGSVALQSSLPTTG